MLAIASMKYQLLAVDYDGTLATDGVVNAETVAALTKLRESGRRLVLVTGRIVEQLTRVFPQLILTAPVCPAITTWSGEFRLAAVTTSP